MKINIIVMFLLSINCLCMAAEQGHQSTLNPTMAQAAKDYPQIVMYSVSWCPHCKEAKEYFTKNNIPFTNLDVEMDEKAMEDLQVKYESNSVPLIVIGKGESEMVVKGFTPDLFQESLIKAKAKNSRHN